MSYGVHPYRVDFERLRGQKTDHLSGYELERFIEDLGGTFLSNRSWSSMRMAWFDGGR